MSEKCPNCGSNRIRKSRVRPGESTVSKLFLRMLHCSDCKNRFWVNDFRIYYAVGFALFCGLPLVYFVWSSINFSHTQVQIERHKSDQLEMTKPYFNQENTDTNSFDAAVTSNHLNSNVASTEQAANLTQKSRADFQLYQEDVQKSDANAQYRLGLLYLTGDGVLQHFGEAAKWFKLAAEKNYAPAQYELGILYHVGHGVEIDQEKSYMWLNLAAASGLHQAVASRDKISQSLSAQQLTHAQEAANEWLLNQKTNDED